MSDKHSPLPWRKHDFNHQDEEIVDREGDWVATVTGGESALIVHAANSHAELVEACHRSMTALVSGTQEDDFEARKFIRAALRKAGDP